MEKNYEKIRKRLRICALLKCTIFGISLGIISGAGYILVRKLMEVQPELPKSTLIALGVALLGFGISLLAVRPTEKRLAKQLDERLQLGEKVQTMIACRENDGLITKIQREDTFELLGEVTPRQLRSRGLWLNFVAPLVALALTVSAILVPVRSPESAGGKTEETESDAWQLEEWQAVRLRTLIEKVQRSDMVDEGKVRVVSVLENLLTTLERVDSKTRMKTEVISAMVNIDGVADGINTFSPIIRALRASSNKRVTDFAEAIGVPSDPIVEGKYQAFKQSFTVENFGSDFKDFARELAIALESVSVSEEDGLFTALMSFSESVSELSAITEVPAEEELLLKISELFENGAQNISAPLGVQGANRSVSDSTNRELMDIFGIQWGELPEELKIPNDDEAESESGEYEEKDDELKSDSGGLGGGEVLYGSNDAVYDPDEQKIVKYGEIIDKYDGKKTSDLEERELEDEILDWINVYFSDLYYNEDND